MIRLTQDTSFGHVAVGAATIDLTMNTLLTQVQTLEAHLQSVSEHSRNTDVVFHWLAFCPEADDGYWYLLNNPNGQGSSAIVNIVSIWSFGASESGTTKWLA